LTPASLLCERNRRDSRTHSAIPPVIWRANELAAVMTALPSAALPSTPRARRLVRERHHRSLTQQIAALRSEGKTWDEVAAAVELSPSRVRDIHTHATVTPDRPNDAAILDNVHAFLLASPTSPSRRAYAKWPGRIAAPTTIENRFDSWARAVELAREPITRVSEVAS